MSQKRTIASPDLASDTYGSFSTFLEWDLRMPDRYFTKITAQLAEDYKTGLVFDAMLTRPKGSRRIPREQ